MNLQAKLWQISFRDESGIGFETINPEYLGHLWGILEAIRRSRANLSAEKLEKSRKKLIGLKVFLLLHTLFKSPFSSPLEAKELLREVRTAT